MHEILVNGIDVEYHRLDHSIGGDKIALIDFDNPDNNHWLVVNQFTVVEENHNRRADVVVFINGLPLAVFELRDTADKRPPFGPRSTSFRLIKIKFPICLFIMKF